MSSIARQLATAISLALLIGGRVALGACGDSLLDAIETCDDGNAFGGDGCSAICQVEANYECTLPVPPEIISGIADGGYEGGTPSDDWAEASVRFSTPLCTTNRCGNSVGSGPNSGSWWAWFGGSDDPEIASLEQEIAILQSDSTLEFWLEVPACDSASDYLAVLIDDNEEFRIQGDDALCGNEGYAHQSIDLSFYNDDGIHTIRFQAETFAEAGGQSSFFVDDVLIDRGLNDPVPSVCTAYESCFAEDFDSGTGSLPGNWTIFETVPQNNNWSTTDDSGCTLGNLTGGSGEAACLDQEAVGSLVDAYLCSEAIDLSGATGSRLRFLLNYQVFQRSADDIFDVLVGTAAPDAGAVAGYTKLYSSNGFDVGTPFAAPGKLITEDFADFEGSEVYMCFRYRANDDWYAQIDDIEVRADACNTVLPPPVAPTVSASDAAFTDYVRVSWNNVSGEDSYEIYRCSNDIDTGSCSLLDTTAANIIQYEDTTADALGALHYYRVRACSSANGCSDYSAADAGNRLYTPPPPDTPGNVTASDAEYTERVRISWSDVSNEERYEVHRCLDGSNTANCGLLAYVSAGVTQYDDLSAKPDGSLNYYRIKACNESGGCSAFSTADAGNRLQFCGDAILGFLEACDDGNDAPGDGCSAVCQVEAGFECSLPVPPAYVNGVADGGFEGGSPSTAWAESSVQFDTPLCTASDCGVGGGSGPHSGTWWAWLGGSASPETASLEQNLTIEADDSALGFWLEVPDCDSASDFFSVALDGNEVFRIDGSYALCGQSGYVPIHVDLATAAGGPYNDGAAHVLRLEAQTIAASGDRSSFFVDDVVIDRGYSAPVPSACNAFESCFLEDFDPGIGGLPAGWSTFEAAGAGAWGTTDDGVCGNTNLTGGNGEAACLDQEAIGSLVDAYLCSDVIDLSSAMDSRLHFLLNYQVYQRSDDDIFDVLLGTAAPDAGTVAGYTKVYASNGFDVGAPFAAPGKVITVDLSSFEGAAVHVCFRYRANDDWYAQLDDIEVRADACRSAPKPDGVFLDGFESGAELNHLP